MEMVLNMFAHLLLLLPIPDMRFIAHRFLGSTKTDRKQRRLTEKGDPKYISTITRAILPKPSLCDEITATKSVMKPL